jgi:hypothetical protein
MRQLDMPAGGQHLLSLLGGGMCACPPTFIAHTGEVVDADGTRQITGDSVRVIEGREALLLTTAATLLIPSARREL